MGKTSVGSRRLAFHVQWHGVYRTRGSLRDPHAKSLHARNIADTTNSTSIPNSTQTELAATRSSRSLTQLMLVLREIDADDPGRLEALQTRLRLHGFPGRHSVGKYG